jgi:PiT family inorganic phosphate transporter
LEVDYLILIIALVAAWSMGHHYAGAVVGPAYGSKAISMYFGIGLAGIFVVLGALITNVISTYVNLAPVSGIYATIVLISLIVVTNLTTYLKIPTSTIQVYAFALIGAALITGTTINLILLGVLVIGWIISPILSYYLSKGIFKIIRQKDYLRYIIIGIMCYSALVMGLNDVSNAASSLVTSGFDVLLAKILCGISMFAGMIIWGGRLIHRVGEDLITMDYHIAVSAQLSKSIVVSILNIFGLNASMNQAIIAALASLGARKDVIKTIILGWIYSPLLGFGVSILLSFIVKLI